MCRRYRPRSSVTHHRSVPRYRDSLRKLWPVFQGTQTVGDKTFRNISATGTVILGGSQWHVRDGPLYPPVTGLDWKRMASLKGIMILALLFKALGVTPKRLNDLHRQYLNHQISLLTSVRETDSSIESHPINKGSSERHRNGIRNGRQHSFGKTHHQWLASNAGHC